MVSAAFFDIFEIIAFIILLYIGIKLKNNKNVKPLIYWIVIIIATLGLIVDLYIVFSIFIF